MKPLALIESYKGSMKDFSEGKSGLNDIFRNVGFLPSLFEKKKLK
jgi:hypothetical protein